MKAFIYNGELYIRCVPGKRLFQSTMVHEVVNRGDIFAVRYSDQQLTIIPGDAEVEHWEFTLQQGEEAAQGFDKQLPMAKLFALQLHMQKAYDDCGDSKLTPFVRTHIKAAQQILEAL